ncbi:MAG: four helix bundle protein [Chitinophagaceae bacterium]
MKENVIVDKSFLFAIKIVNQYKILCEVKREFVLSKQMLRSGTSIGANVREAHNGESKNDFIHKMAIAQKEAAEVLYWAELLYKTEYLSNEEYNSLYKDATELIKIIKSIIISTKQNVSKLER